METIYTKKYGDKIERDGFVTHYKMTNHVAYYNKYTYIVESSYNLLSFEITLKLKRSLDLQNWSEILSTTYTLFFNEHSAFNCVYANADNIYYVYLLYEDRPSSKINVSFVVKKYVDNLDGLSLVSTNTYTLLTDVNWRYMANLIDFCQNDAGDLCIFWNYFIYVSSANYTQTAVVYNITTTSTYTYTTFQTIHEMSLNNNTSRVMIKDNVAYYHIKYYKWLGIYYVKYLKFDFSSNTFTQMLEFQSSNITKIYMLQTENDLISIAYNISSSTYYKYTFVRFKNYKFDEDNTIYSNTITNQIITFNLNKSNKIDGLFVKDTTLNIYNSFKFLNDNMYKFTQYESTDLFISFGIDNNIVFVDTDGSYVSYFHDFEEFDYDNIIYSNTIDYNAQTIIIKEEEIERDSLLTLYRDVAVWSDDFESYDVDTLPSDAAWTIIENGDARMYVKEINGSKQLQFTENGNTSTIHYARINLGAGSYAQSVIEFDFTEGDSIPEDFGMGFLQSGASPDLIGFRINSSNELNMYLKSSLVEKIMDLDVETTYHFKIYIVNNIYNDTAHIILYVDDVLVYNYEANLISNQIYAFQFRCYKIGTPYNNQSIDNFTFNTHEKIIEGFLDVQKSDLNNNINVIKNAHSFEINDKKITKNYTSQKTHENLNDIITYDLDFVNETISDNSYTDYDYKCNNKEIKKVFEDFGDRENIIIRIKKNGSCDIIYDIFSNLSILEIDNTNIINFQKNLKSFEISKIVSTGGYVNGEYLTYTYYVQYTNPQSSNVMYVSFANITDIDELKIMTQNLANQFKDQITELIVEIDHSEFLEVGEIVEVCYPIWGIGTEDSNGDPDTYEKFYIHSSAQQNEDTIILKLYNAYVFDLKKIDSKKDLNKNFEEHDTLNDQIVTVEDRVATIETLTFIPLRLYGNNWVVSSGAYSAAKLDGSSTHYATANGRVPKSIDVTQTLYIVITYFWEANEGTNRNFKIYAETIAQGETRGGWNIANNQTITFTAANGSVIKRVTWTITASTLAIDDIVNVILLRNSVAGQHLNIVDINITN